jgi:hypothetical protein
MTLSLFADQDLRRLGVARFGVIAAHDQGNIAGEPVSLGVMANWRLGF